MKNAIAILMLVVLIPGKSVQAQTAPVETTPVVSEVVEVSADVTPAPTVQTVLLDVCTTRGYGDTCAKHLLGMLWNESSNVYNAVGDRGKASGYFQIWTKLHKITVACAEDLVCSANWTLTYMERNSYKKYPTWAIQCHNGCGINNGYAAKALRNGKNFWNAPLEVKQVAPIVLPSIAKAEAQAEAKATQMALALTK
jgi:hypothetical protein